MEIKNLTKTIFAALSYPEFYKIKGSSINVIASTYFVDNNELQDYNVMNNILDTLDIRHIVIISVTNKEIIEKVLEYKGLNNVIKNIIVSYDDFFSNIGIKKFLIDQEFKIEVFNINNGNVKEIIPSFVLFKFEETT